MAADSVGRAAAKATDQSRHTRAQFPEVRARGARISFHDDLYPFILKLTWPRFFGVFALCFVVLNAAFAGLYMLRPGSVSGASGFIDHFFFSIETFATIGYGEMTPNGHWAHVVMSLEAMMGICATALMTGLVFARFTRPRAQILFTDKMIIANWNGVPHLMFRMANQRQNQLAEAQLHVAVLMAETTKEGTNIRVPVDVPLVRSKNPMFALTWLARHKIDETSPFFGEEGLARIRRDKADVFVSLTGFDETLMQTVVARFRYTPDHIVKAKAFADMITTGEDGVRQLDYDNFHQIIPEDA